MHTQNFEFWDFSLSKPIIKTLQNKLKKLEYERQEKKN